MKTELKSIYHSSHAVRLSRVSTQPAFTCSKLTIETLKQGVRYVQS